MHIINMQYFILNSFRPTYIKTTKRNFQYLIFTQYLYEIDEQIDALTIPG